MVDEVTEKPPEQVRGAVVPEHSNPYNLKTNLAADSLQV